MVGMLAELMVKTNTRLYRQYIVLEKGRSVLYLQLQKALYGMMKSVLEVVSKSGRTISAVWLLNTPTEDI
jgi:hypothetical protein